VLRVAGDDLSVDFNLNLFLQRDKQLIVYSLFVVVGHVPTGETRLSLTILEEHKSNLK